MNKIPTIALFAAHFPPCPGGISKFMGITAEALAQKGCKVIVVTSDFGDIGPLHPNVTVVKLPIHHWLPGSERYPVPAWGTRVYNKAINILRSSNIDRVIALTRFHPTSHVAARFASQQGIPLYLLECGANRLTVNNRFLDAGINIVERLLTAKIRPAVHKWGAMSKAGGDFLKQEYGIESKFIWHCSIDVPDLVDRTENKDEVVITYSGRIENLKGEEEIARSFSQLVKIYPNLRLNFLGDGSYLPTLKTNYIDDRITYMGNVGPNVVDAVNRSTDIFICATRFPDGAVPNAVLEAGAAKCAVITSPNGGFIDLMDDGRNGLLTAPDLSDMKECIERLIIDRDLRVRLAKELYRDVKKLYRPDMVAESIIKDIA